MVEEQLICDDYVKGHPHRVCRELCAELVKGPELWACVEECVRNIRERCGLA